MTKEKEKLLEEWAKGPIWGSPEWDKQHAEWTRKENARQAKLKERQKERDAVKAIMVSIGITARPR